MVGYNYMYKDIKAKLKIDIKFIFVLVPETRGNKIGLGDRI